MDLQPILENDQFKLSPLKENDFSVIYDVAADPEIWAQHPNQDRWQREVFQTFFEGALQSRGAFRIVDKSTGTTIGSTRFYDLDEAKSQIFIGYTFYATAYWGTGVNRVIKGMMLDYAFQFVNHVQFHIGSANIRSQIAIARLGAVKVGEQEVTYFGETPKLNYVYEISKTDWQHRQQG
ncbi:GNAT family N-acetyltransferase [Pedobacter sp. BMA]|uniref:GNAT family N-acetyltransferase n=1 Tax=Pedobacter sp. BMA TaxID=1663685 RepID=UPI00064B2EDB|nr:GNAT family N-acetyltransferase [Pedobacter sp. BMA]KLT63866.1 acetyltransferase [Pedobacter sp. BMA]